MNAMRSTDTYSDETTRIMLQKWYGGGRDETWALVPRQGQPHRRVHVSPGKQTVSGAVLMNL